MHDVRVIGVGVTVLLLGVVMIGLDFETKAQLVLLVILIISIVNFFVGTFIPPSEDKRRLGFVGYDGRCDHAHLGFVGYDGRWDQALWQTGAYLGEKCCEEEEERRSVAFLCTLASGGQGCCTFKGKKENVCEEKTHSYK